MRSGAPQTTTTASQPSTNTSAVPVSGCVSTGASSPPSSARVKSSAGRRGARELAYAASASTSASFASSEGWNVAPPRESQRRAPYSLSPATAASSSSAAASSQAAALPWRSTR